MDRATLRLFENFSLPAWDEDPRAWIIDTNSSETGYTEPGMWLRLAMGRRKRRGEAATRDLARWVHGMQGELHDVAGFPHDIDPMDIARVLMVKALLLDKNSPFIVVTTYFGGYTEFWSGRYEGWMLSTPHIALQRPVGWDA